MIDRDVAIIICSRRREDVLTNLLSDLQRGFTPALDAGGLTHCVWVYAQGYTPAFLAALREKFAAAVAAERLVVIAADRTHVRIGDVVQTAIRTIHESARYKLAMLMDDDSVYDPDPVVDRNLQEAARSFIAHEHRAYSIKLGDSTELGYWAFVELAGPIMPFKEKMLWVSRQVLDEVLEMPRFCELSIGEDAVIAALAWLPDPDACFAVYGMATFLHLGFESSPRFADGQIEGGYADLSDYKGPTEDQPSLTKYDEPLRTGVTPHHIMPDVFVSESHPHYIFNGIRDEVMARVRAADRKTL